MLPIFSLILYKGSKKENSSTSQFCKILTIGIKHELVNTP